MFFLYYSIHSATVRLFDVCLPAVKDAIFSHGCSQYTVIYFVELYITTESIFSYRYIHCFFILFILFLFWSGEVGQGLGECWYIVHIQSASVFSCPALPVCDVEIFSLWYGRYPPNTKHLPLTCYWHSGAVLAVCSWSAPFLWPVEWELS